MPGWPPLPYEGWSATYDTLHGHAQVVGKIAVVLAPPEPELQHVALRLTSRGLETQPLPAADGSAIVVALDLHAHQAVVESSAGTAQRIPLTPDRSVGEIARAVLAAARDLAGPIEINRRPQEVPWTAPLDQDEEHSTYDPAQVETWFEAATSVALVLAAYRAPYRGRSTPVNFWWGSFDLAVSLFSGRPAAPPSDDFITRNSMDSQELAVGWWPGNSDVPKAAFYAYAHPRPDGYDTGKVSPAAAYWDDALGEFILDWDDVIAEPDPRAAALDFMRSAGRHGCTICQWDPPLAASLEGDPPPVA